MSRNGSYAKSMNGIVSFDDGDGTTIEGSVITTDTIDCNTLNATLKVNTASLSTDFITPYANSQIQILPPTTFNDDIYIGNVYSNSGTAGTIGLNNNTSIIGTLETTQAIRSSKFESKLSSGPTQLKIGQDSDYTSSVYIGRAEFNLLGITFPAIPPRTTFYAVGNDDIANKLYVDNATTGTNILSLSNTFTGAMNTFNNKIQVSNILYDTNSIGSTGPTNNISLFTSTTGNITLGSTGQINLGSNIYVLGKNIFTSSVSDTYETYSNVTTGNLRYGFGLTSGILSLANNITSGTVNIATSIGSGSTGKINIGSNLASTGEINIATGINYVGGSGIVNIATGTGSTTQINIGSNLDPTAIIKIGTAIQVTNTGIQARAGSATAIELFKDIISGTVTTCNNLVMSGSNYNCSGVNDTIRLMEKITSGALRICNGMTSGTVYIADASLTTGSVNMCGSYIFKVGSITSSAINSTVNLFTNLTTGTLNLGTGITTGILNLGTGITLGTLNIGDSVAGGNINIGQNLTTTGNGANINIGTGPKSNITIGNLTNNSSASYNGCCTIAKLKLGYGTAFRGMIMGSNIGSGLSGVQNYTIPNAPTTLGNPLVFTQANAGMSVGYIWSVAINVTGPNTFQYWKRLQLGSTTTDFGESFNYIAVWI